MLRSHPKKARDLDRIPDPNYFCWDLVRPVRKIPERQCIYRPAIFWEGWFHLFVYFSVMYIFCGFLDSCPKKKPNLDSLRMIP